MEPFSAAECDIRIQLLSIAEEHVKITRNEHGQVKIVRVKEEFIHFIFLFRLFWLNLMMIALLI